MNWRISFILFSFLAIASCKRAVETPQKTDAPLLALSEYFNTEHLIEAYELLESLSNPSYKIIDFRTKDEYLKNHIPKAINIWRSDIENHNYPYPGMMASKEVMESLFSKLGIQNNDTLIVYDNRGSCDAARLWWVLQNYGFESVKLLNGGYSAWQNIDGMVSNRTAAVVPSTFRFSEESPSMKLRINREEVLNAINETNQVLLLDVRSLDEFTGKRQKKGASKAGRIPDSKCIDWGIAINHDTTKKFKPYEELDSIYGILGVKKDHLVITYCHSGVRSAHTTFVLTELLGYTNVKNYDGSWVEWSYMNEYPISKDSTTTIMQ